MGEFEKPRPPMTVGDADGRVGYVPVTCYSLDPHFEFVASGTQEGVPKYPSPAAGNTGNRNFSQRNLSLPSFESLLRVFETLRRHTGPMWLGGCNLVWNPGWDQVDTKG